MIQIYDDDTLVEALEAVRASDILAAVDRIVHDAKASELWELTCLIIFEPGERAADLEPLMGFDPLKGPLHVEDEPFQPYWAWLERHTNHFEMLITAGDTGFAYFVLIPDEDGNDMAALCRRYAGKLDF